MYARRSLCWTSVRFLLAFLALCLTGCTSYASFVATFNDRKVNSCIEGTVNVGFPVATGMLHVYTATGGELVSECIQFFKNMTISPAKVP